MHTVADPKSNEKLDDVNIRFQIMSFFIAANESTTGMLSFTIYLLLTHPHVLNKMLKEMDLILGADAYEVPSLGQLNKLVYMQSILSESLRLYPTAPMFGVAPKKDVILGGRYFIKKGQRIDIVLSSLHRSKEVWGEKSDHFNPEHFSPEYVSKRDPDFYKPFGNGLRSCIGRHFVFLEAKVALIMIFRKYHLRLQENFKLKINETVFLKPEKLPIIITKR